MKDLLDVGYTAHTRPAPKLVKDVLDVGYTALSVSSCWTRSGTPLRRHKERTYLYYIA